jgi:hypothetical protein
MLRNCCKHVQSIAYLNHIFTIVKHYSHFPAALVNIVIKMLRRFPGCTFCSIAAFETEILDTAGYAMTK